MTTTRLPRTPRPICPGCGLYPHTHGWEHRTDCTAEQTPEHEALANIAEVFGPHLDAAIRGRITRSKRKEIHMTICTFCGGPTADGGASTGAVAGSLPDDPRHAAVSVADHIVRVLTPKRVQRARDGRPIRKPAEAMSPAQLRARLRPELYEHFDDGLELALAAGAIRCEPSGAYRLAPTPRRNLRSRKTTAPRRSCSICRSTPTPEGSPA